MNINNDNKNNNKQTGILVAGSVACVAQKGLEGELNLLNTIYDKNCIDKQPIMFNEEAEHFNKLVDYIKLEINNGNKNSELDDLYKKLIITENKTDELIHISYDIYNSNQAKEARTHSDAWLGLCKKAIDEQTTDSELIKMSNHMLTTNQLNNNETKLLTEFLNDTSKRKNFFNPRRIEFLITFKNLSNLAQNVIIDPKLIQCAKQMYKEFDLDKKGVSYTFATPEYLNQLKEKVKQNIKTSEEKQLKQYELTVNDNLFTKVYKKFKTALIKVKYKSILTKNNKVYNALLEGKNAYYLSVSKYAMVPLMHSKKEAIFHELGHAINYNSDNKLIKFIRHLKFKIPKITLPIVFLSAVFLKKTNNTNEEKSKLTKIREFIRNNIMTIVLFIKAPVLIEEGIASVRAVRFLKNKITPKQLKNIKIKSMLSWGSYGINALSTALLYNFSAWLSNKVQSNK